MISKFITRIFGTSSDRETKQLLPIVTQINEQYEALSASTQDDLMAKTEAFRTRIKSETDALQTRLEEEGKDSKVIGIGETGLDYFRSEGDLGWQHQRFRHHIRAAKILDKPLIVHTREARDDTIRILQEEEAHEVGGVIHCFTEDWAMAEKALALNFYISFSGIVTFKNARQVQEVAQRIPEDRFLIETDSPYLAPVPFRGKPNYPLYVHYVAEFLAQLRNTNVEEIAEQSSRNFRTLFYNRTRSD